MREIWQIYLRDLRRLFMNFSIALVALGVSVIPALYAWFNIAADMDPYGRTNNILVAVSSQDRTVHTSELGDLNVGRMLVAQLHENHQLGWRFVSAKEAKEGVKSAKYAAAIIVPKDFSLKLYRLTDFSSAKKPVTPTFDYYVNEKISAIAPKVTDSGASTLEETINTTIVQTASKAVAQQIRLSAGKLQKKAGSSVDRAASSVVQAASSVNDVSTDLKNLTDGLASTQKTVRSSRSALSQLASQADGLKKNLSGTESDISQARASAGQLSANANSLFSTGLSQTGSAIGAANSGITEMTGRISAAKAPVDSALSSAQATNSQAQSMISSLQQAQSQLHALLNDSSTVQLLPQSVRDRLAAAESTLETLTSTMSDTNSGLGTAIGQMRTASDGIGNLADAAASASNSFASATNSQLNTISQLNSRLASTTLPAIDSSLDTLQDTKGQISDQLTTVSLTARSASQALGQLDSTLGRLEGTLGQTRQQLGDLRDSLSSTAHDVAAISSSQAIKELSQLLGLKPSTVGSFMASPARLRTITVYPVKNYGTAMTPIYTNVTLWVGCIMLVIVFRMEVDLKDLADGHRHLRITPSKGYLARYMLLATMAIFQALVVSIGDMLLGIGVAHPGAFIFACVFCSLIYLAICYMLASCFQHIGKALCVVLIIIQIPGTTGVYPIEMMPGFYQFLRPIEPWNYGMQLMREAIGGYYDDTYGRDLLALLLFAVLAFAIGLLLRPRMTNLNGMFDRQIARTDFFNGEEGDLPPARVSIHQIVMTLASRTDFREQMIRRAAAFDRVSPHLVTASFVLLFLLPTVPFLMSLTPNSKLVNLGIWVIVVLLVLSFVVIIEYVHEAIHRELSLADLTDEDLGNLAAQTTNLPLERLTLFPHAAHSAGKEHDND